MCVSVRVVSLVSFPFVVSVAHGIRVSRCLTKQLLHAEPRPGGVKPVRVLWVLQLRRTLSRWSHSMRLITGPNLCR